MSQPPVLQTSLPVIPDFEKFGNTLYDRIYVNLKFHETLKHRFTILLTLINRESKEDIENGIFVYGGVEKQRLLLGANNDELGEAWSELKNLRLAKSQTVETQFLFSEAEKQDLDISDFIDVEALKDYFDLDPTEEWNVSQIIEHPILDKYFDIATARYVSIPIYSFAQLQGVASIVFTQADYEGESEEVRTKRKDSIKRICRVLMQEFDALVLDWDLETTGGSHYLTSRATQYFELLSTQEYYEVMDKNPILKDMGCQEYYKLSLDYLKDRIEENNKIPRLFLEEHRRRAIIAILIDSYAHNISAHSLTVLKWWFLQRGDQFHSKEALAEIDQKLPFSAWGVQVVDFLEQQFPDMYQRKELEVGVQMMFARGYNQLRIQKHNVDFQQLPVRDQIFPLAKELAPLFKFLLEKGAFWSGVTRDQQFGGEITNFFEILWTDFIQNPLYLGTIAYSERITRLNLHIRIYEPYNEGKDIDPDTFRRTYRIKSINEGSEKIYLDHVLASIDVATRPQDPKTLHHDFIRKGKYFDLLKTELEKCEVFFPGGVVGKHAFFTIVENEIRNVKHFTPEEHANMRENGLTLTIAIHPTALNRIMQYPVNAVFKIGVWLNHRTRMDSDGEHLLIKRLFNLRNDIITNKTNRAKLGGNYQDKICAAMLFNNTFISVQGGEDYENRKENDPIDRKMRDRLYYPWIRAAMSQGPKADDPGTEHDFEIRMMLVDKGIAQEELATHPKDEKAFFKKYFHLWQGAFLLSLDRAEYLEVENVARFRIVQIRPKQRLFKEIREKGVIRILQKEEQVSGHEEAYHLWLQTWLGEEVALRFVFRQDDQDVSHLIYDETGVQYFPAELYNELDEYDREDYEEYEEHLINMAHSERSQNEQITATEFIGIRSHGILATKFLDNLPSLKDLYYARIRTPLLAYELVEAMATRLCIFDKRVVDRVPDAQHRKLLGDYLHCGIYGESPEQWEQVKQAGLDRYHFIIMHLSFIESLTDKRGMRYGEKYIVRFIEDEIIALRREIGQNFLFIITTGRGRNQWWEEISRTSYTDFVSFRPVESLIEAVESARLKKDDVELKYNLVKVLMGS